LRKPASLKNELPSSPGAKSWTRSPSASLKVPLQCRWAWSPAAPTQSTPASVAALAIPSGVPGAPVPSPRLVPNHPTACTITCAPWPTAKSFASPRPTSVFAHSSISAARGAMSWTISATAAPWPSGLKPPPQ
jgi:hypothetical protein